jgi:hypothetical protein
MCEEIDHGDGYVDTVWCKEWREEQIQRLFYKLDGWEKYYPYEKRPQWLRKRYP